MSEELKPCPQCGGQVRRILEKQHFMCIECEMDLPFDYRDWWFSKTIDKQQHEIDTLKEQIEDYKKRWEHAEDANIKLSQNCAELRKRFEVMREIARDELYSAKWSYWCDHPESGKEPDPMEDEKIVDAEFERRMKEEGNDGKDDGRQD